MTGTDDQHSFGALLRNARLEADLTQENLSARSGLSVRSISDLERGRTLRPYPRTVMLLADALEAAEPVRAELHEAARRGRRMTIQVLPGTIEPFDGAQPDQLTSQPAHADVALAIAGRGKRGLQETGPRVKQHDVIPQQLPATVADFTGREREIALLATALTLAGRATAVPAMVICGQPGVGKSTLALRVAHTVRPSFPDGQLWVHLAGASGRPRDPGEVLGELLRALGVHGPAIPSGEAERAALYRSRLADRRVLLVADDAGSSAQVRPLMPGTSGSAVLVTSRIQLAGLPGAGLQVLDPFTPGEAMSLLTRMAGENRVTAEPEAAGELAAACGLMPLAVRIAGARLAARPAWPVSLLVQKMAGRRRRLDELEAEDLSVRVSVALSYDALGGQAQRAFRLLGLLGPQDVAEWAVAALLGQPDASPLVNELTEKSLLTSVGIDGAGQARYRLHDLLREYANERLTEESAQEQDTALRRTLTGWLQLADLASGNIQRDPFFPSPTQPQPPPVLNHELAGRLVTDPLAWFTAERLNLLEAVHHAASMGWLDLAIPLAIAQGNFQYLQDRTDESAHLWCEIMAAAGRGNHSTAVALAEVRYTGALVVGGRAADAAGIISHCVRQLETADDPVALAFALYWRAAVAYDLDQFGAALQDGYRGIALARQAGNRHAEFLSLRIIGQSLAYLGHAAEGLQACERGVILARELGQESYEVIARHALAYAYVLVGDYGRAAPLCLNLVERNRQIGNVRGEGQVLGLLGDSYHGLGRYQEAAQALSEALPIFRDHANRRHHGLCLLKLGEAYQRMSRNQQAAGYLKEGLAIFRELHLPRYERRARDALADSLSAASDGHRNRGCYSQPR